MELEVKISDKAAEWLQQEARATGTDEAVVAAEVLEQHAARQLGENGQSAEDRLQLFRKWVSSLPARPGPPVDASRNSIYD